MKNPVIINIHGCCVTRDIFSYDWNTVFKINKYISRNSLFSTIEAPVILEEDSFLLSGNYKKRMVLYDFNKMVFEELSEKADYFILDLIDERLALMKISNDKESVIVTATTAIKEESDLLTGRYRNYRINNIDPTRFSDKKIEEAVLEYISRLKGCIDTDRVIIHEAYFVEYYMNSEGSKKKFDDTILAFYIGKLNPLLRKMYELLKENLPGCSVIPMPEIVYGDENHKWGKAPMHYQEEYYHYIYNQLVKITEARSGTIR